MYNYDKRNLKIGGFMQRYFIENEQMVDGEVIITGEDVHHIRDVMRGRVGDNVILCTCDKVSYLVEIVDLNQMEVKFKVVEKRIEFVELPILVTIAQGITKGDKFDFVLQKATECGASEFIPVAMKRSIAKIDAKKADKKVFRWRKIAMEAARQAHRQIVPSVGMPIDMKDLIQMAMRYDVCLFAYEACDTDNQQALADEIKKFETGMRVLILIGPEGGIDEVEVDVLRRAGFRAIGLGPRILRTETAPIYVMSALSYALEIEGR